MLPFFNIRNLKSLTMEGRFCPGPPKTEKNLSMIETERWQRVGTCKGWNVGWREGRFRGVFGTHPLSLPPAVVL